MRERGHVKLITILSRAMRMELEREHGYWPDVKREVRARLMEQDGNLNRLDDLAKAMAFAVSKCEEVKISIRRLT